MLNYNHARICRLINKTITPMNSVRKFILKNKDRISVITSVLPIAIGYNKGVGNVVLKSLRVIKNEGLSGLKNRVLTIYAQTIPGPLVKNSDDYQAWIEKYDQICENSRVSMADTILRMESKPLISIVMPTYNSNPKWLVEAIESVRKQIYSNWELCIADDASTDNETRKILQNYSRIDNRIKVTCRDKNGHISAATNSALELVRSEWYALMDHDDLLSENALYWVVNAINHNPDARLLYSDEDKVDENGIRADAYFKSDWNYDLFMSQNMVTHLGVYRADITRAIGGFRIGYEGAQDYDHALRYVETIRHTQIVHIPRLLYHWRTHKNSTSQSLDAKPYGVIAGEKALNDSLKRRAIDAIASSTEFGYRVKYRIEEPFPKVSIIIPTRNGYGLLKQCIESITEKSTYCNYDILIIDNGSDDPDTLKYLQILGNDTRVHVIRDDKPFNYSRLNNAAVRLVSGEFVLLLNNDIEVISPDWMEEMLGLAMQPGVGAVGARLWYPDETLQHGGVVLGIGGVAGHSHKYLARNLCGYFSRAQLIQSFSAVTAACLMIKKDIYFQVGGLDEVNLSVAFNDVDFCLKVREAGYRNVWTPYAELYHHESATRGLEDSEEKKKRFSSEVHFMLNKWGNLLESDPAYNPNLSLKGDSFDLAWPPRLDKTN